MAGVAGDRRALKEALLDLLEEDREFRHAVMGLLGYRELLERFARLEERQQVLEERQQRLEERFARLEERFARLEERFAELEERMLRLEERIAKLEERQQLLEERFVKLEERFAELEERFARLEERFARLEEEFLELRKAQQRLEERQQRLEERVLRVEERLEQLSRAVQELTAKIMALGHRYGAATEEAFRGAVKYLVEDLLRGYRAVRWTAYDREGLVFGHPSVVEVDVLVKDDVHVLVEYKSLADRADVAELYRIGRLYEKETGVRPRLLLVAPGYRRRARELAEQLGVEIRGEQVD
ncbi:PD-(D/E)XK nuclease family protein [Pyrodictium abyssi]|uniref:DUF3782 domain-containing protein n=1 Tax=Pyrodictium abyssi TaxID=54256 RepID=A0ABN6ZRM2_9CREN|nr:hypothetical protein PABY_06170 [Pyrodictium abyssi]